MNKILLALMIVLVPSVSFAQSTVRCPTPPKRQGNVNHIFFSFKDKSANLGTYLPKNLVLVGVEYLKNGPRCLTKQTYEAFLSMNDALKKDTGESLLISSAWRSPKTQMYFAKNRSEFAANPGRSEHQLGTAMDLDFVGSKEEDFFIDSKAYKWMIENAHNYGFVQSFDLAGQELTNIPNEPWHWRYVGKTIATKVKTEKLNLAQYLFDRKEAKKKGLSY